MGAHRGQRHVGRCRLHNDSHGKTIYPQPYVQVDDDEPTGPRKRVGHGGATPMPLCVRERDQSFFPFRGGDLHPLAAKTFMPQPD